MDTICLFYTQDNELNEIAVYKTLDDAVRDIKSWKECDECDWDMETKTHSCKLVVCNKSFTSISYTFECDKQRYFQFEVIEVKQTPIV